MNDDFFHDIKKLIYNIPVTSTKKSKWFEEIIKTLVIEIVNMKKRIEYLERKN